MDLGGQILPFARDLREVLAVYARRRWTLNTTGQAAKAWGLPKSTVANLLKGSASDATVTAILRAGGWSLAIAVIGATIGESLDQFIDSERERLAHERNESQRRDQRLMAMADHLRSRDGLGSDSGVGVAPVPHRRRSSDRRRVVSGRH